MNQNANEVVLVHAPYGRDATIICQVFESAAIGAKACSTIGELCASLGEETGAVLISDEALTQSNVASLASIIETQPPWSDIPLIVTTSGGEATAASKLRILLLEPLGNLSLLERPLRKVTLISAVKIALRARRRQFQLREHFLEREKLLREVERSNDELAQFAHVVSHDLQAPIRMVRTFSQLLTRRYQGRLDADADHLIESIQSGGLIMQELVETLLQYATVGQEPMKLTDVDLATIVHDVLAILQPTIDELGASILCESLPVVCGDPLQLRQIVQNLVGNALKYARKNGPPVIKVIGESDGRLCRISVRDNGPGIAPRYHDLVFQPLKRLHGQDISGTGMGLAVCRKIIERHGGKIWVESKLGEGATFVFTISPANHALA